MIENIVLDTSAFLTFIENEAGAPEVHGYIANAIAGGVKIFASFVSLVEIAYITLQEEGSSVAVQRMSDLQLLPVEWIHSDVSICRIAARLKASHKISLADSFVAATAIQFDALLIHKDPEFTSIANTIKQKMLPPKVGDPPNKKPAIQ